MAAAIDRNEDVRRRMVTDVAHELRAPLTNLRCELESIQDGLTPASSERIASLHDEVMHLSALVDDLQDLSLADAGKLEIDKQRVNAAEVVRRAVGRRPIAIHGDESVSVLADPRRLVQIITNLISNAVAAHATEVHVAWETGVTIRVSDNGIGIAPDHLPHIFDRFYRVDPSRSRATGGAGLGLSIVKQLVLAHGGRVWAESVPGEGTTVAFTIPS
jgi:signal transduction histidine kinase